MHGLQDEHTPADLAAWRPLVPKAFPVTGPRSFGYSPALNDSFLRETPDVAHLHALWMFTSVVVHRWSQAKHRPYVVTPNGMLEPWALRNSAWKKRIAGWLYERSMLESAACLQANTEKEAADIRAFGLKNPIAIIPNGIDLPGQIDHETTGQRDNETGNQTPEVRGQPSSIFHLLSSDRRILLYLGRLHPKKGLVNLLRAWARVQKSVVSGQWSDQWVLALAGWDQGGHEKELKQLATELGLAWEDWRQEGDRRSEIGSGKGGGQTPISKLLTSRDAVPNLPSSKPPSVVFLGPQFNEAKAACYANCDAFILPSFSEGLPMVILEAWAYGKPVLMTPECNLPEGFTANAAIRIEPNVESIVQGLDMLFQSSISDLQFIGSRGRALVASRFTWPQIAADMKSVYQWLLGRGPRPECVVLD